MQLLSQMAHTQSVSILRPIVSGNWVNCDIHALSIYILQVLWSSYENKELRELLLPGYSSKSIISR